MSNLSPAAILYDSAGTEKATAANPLRVDPTGTTAQPVTDGGGSLTVDGSVTVTDGGGSITVDGTVTVTDGGGSLTVDDGGSSLTVDGTVTVTDGGGSLTVDDGGGSLTVDGTVTANQGTAAALAGAWPAKITDGTNGPAAVKGASTEATTADPSLVVQISPNQQPIPTSVVPPTAIAGSAVGRATGIAANTFTVVRATTYVEQTTQAQRSIVSTSANDTAAGTGARTVTIEYYNATGAGPFTETVTLNGLTAVNTTATDICFIERMDVVTVGSNGSNVGTINLYTGTGATGTIFAAIGTGNIAAGQGDNQTLYAHHYVPAGYEIAGYYVSVGIVAAAGGGSSVSVIRYRNPTSATSPWKLASDIINAAQGNSASRVYYVSIKIPGPLVVAAFSTPANNNSTLTCSFDYSDAPV